MQQSDPNCEFLKTVWPNVKDQMSRIREYFDPASTGDGVIRLPQQNTYDTSMQGANTFIGSYYVTALRAVAGMAALMGEDALASSCQARARLAAINYEKICWVEEYGYYKADVTIKDCANSYGPGCFVDQVRIQLCCS